MMTVTVMKTVFRKLPAKVITYRDYKNYSHEKFRENLELVIPRNYLCNISNDEFVEVFMNTFDIHAPLKQKYLRANQGPFMTKALSKAIMKRSRLRSKFNQDKSVFSKMAYNKQRNYCTNLLRKSRKDYYSNIITSCVRDAKKF